MVRNSMRQMRTAFTIFVFIFILPTFLPLQNASAQIRASSEKASAARLQEITRRLNRMEAVKAVEKLQFTYGYYQDRFLWDQVLSLFSNDTPEAHYMGGVWKGRAGLKRLWLGYLSSTYANGAVGPVAGRLFDMPQWQGVIDVSPDSQTARGRFRNLVHTPFITRNKNGSLVSTITTTSRRKASGKSRHTAFAVRGRPTISTVGKTPTLPTRHRIGCFIRRIRMVPTDWKLPLSDARISIPAQVWIPFLSITL